MKSNKQHRNGFPSERRSDRNDKRGHNRHDRSHKRHRSGSARREARRKADELSTKKSSGGDCQRSDRESRHGFHGMKDEKPNSAAPASVLSSTRRELMALELDVYEYKGIDSNIGDDRWGVASSMLHRGSSGVPTVLPPGARHLSSLPATQMVDPTEPPPPGVEPDEFSLNMVESLPSAQAKWERLSLSGSQKGSAPPSMEMKQAPSTSPAPLRRNRWSTGPPPPDPTPVEEPKKQSGEAEKPTGTAPGPLVKPANKPSLEIEHRNEDALSATKRESPNHNRKKAEHSPDRGHKQMTRRVRSSSPESPRRRTSRSRSRGRRGRSRSSSAERCRRQRNRSRSMSHKKGHRSAGSSSRSDHHGRMRNRRGKRDFSVNSDRERGKRARRRSSSSSSKSSSSSSSGDSDSSGWRRRRGRHSKHHRRSSTSSSGSSSS